MGKKENKAQWNNAILMRREEVEEIWARERKETKLKTGTKQIKKCKAKQKTRIVGQNGDGDDQEERKES